MHLEADSSPVNCVKFHFQPINWTGSRILLISSNNLASTLQTNVPIFPQLFSLGINKNKSHEITRNLICPDTLSPVILVI